MLARHIAAKPGNVRLPQTVESRKQQQRILGRLTKRFSFFDQQKSPFRGSPGFWGGLSFDILERVYQRNLKLDFFTAKRRLAGQRRNLSKRACELLEGFNQRRPLYRSQCCFAPQPGGLVDQASLGVVPRQQVRVSLGGLCKLLFKNVCDTGVERASRLAQQRAIGSFLHQSMLEQIGRVRWHALAEKQTGFDKTVK